MLGGWVTHVGGVVLVPDGVVVDGGLVVTCSGACIVCIVCVVIRTGFETRAGHEYGSRRVWVWVTNFGPTTIPVPMRGYTGIGTGIIA